MKNLYNAALVHSGYAVKDPHTFSRSVFSLINTAFNIKEKDQTEELIVTQEDLDSIEEPAPATE